MIQFFLVLAFFFTGNGIPRLNYIHNIFIERNLLGSAIELNGEKNEKKKPFPIGFHPTEAFRTPIFRIGGPDKNGFNLGRYNNIQEVFGDDRRLWLLPIFTR